MHMFSSVMRHTFWIAGCSFAVFLVLIFTFFQSLDVADYLSGDILSSGEGLSDFEWACYIISTVMSAPLRWVGPKHPSLGLAFLLGSLVASGVIIYLIGYTIFRAFRYRTNA